MIPRLEIDCILQPVTFDVVKFHVKINPVFQWSGRWHSGAESFWFWVEDTSDSKIRHHEHLVVTKRSETLVLNFYIPTFGKTSGQYAVRALSDTWVGVDQIFTLSFDESTKLPRTETNLTDLQNLAPLPITALQEPRFEKLYSSKFQHFNPVRF